MHPTKGDLVLISNKGAVATCLLLTDLFVICSSTSRGFYYSVCLETGLYGIVYTNEISAVVCEGFDTNHEF